MGSSVISLDEGERNGLGSERMKNAGNLPQIRRSAVSILCLGAVQQAERRTRNTNGRAIPHDGVWLALCWRNGM